MLLAGELVLVLIIRTTLNCSQEVDRTEKLFPILKKAGYSHVYKAGNRKKHGSVIAYRRDLFEEVGDRRVLYDEEEVRSEGGEKARRGSSFFTKNIGNLVALRRLDNEKEGVVVATTHLFWHPRQAYDRTHPHSRP